MKRPRLPLAPFDLLVARHPTVRLLYVGPVLDPEEGEALRDALRNRPWAKHIGAVPHAAMRSLLLASDVMLNCSLSEGGMANSVLSWYDSDGSLPADQISRLVAAAGCDAVLLRS